MRTRTRPMTPQSLSMIARWSASAAATASVASVKQAYAPSPIRSKSLPPCRDAASETSS